MSSEGYLEDEATRHAIYVAFFAAHEAETVTAFIAQTISTAKARVAEGMSKYGTQRYERQIQVLQRDLAAIQSEMKVKVVGDMQKLAAQEITYNIKVMEKVVRPTVQLHTPAPQIITSAATFDPMSLEARKGVQRISINGALDQFTTKKSAEIISEIQIGSALGEPSQAIGRRLTGIHGVQRDQASALVRTITNHVASTARNETLRANDDILEGWRWISTLDGRTSHMCQSRDQKLYGWDDPRPPGHWNCRSSSVPVLKKEYAREIPGSTRPSVGPDGTKPVASGTSYQEWLARQTVAFQKEVLGPNRYELFSKGGLSLDSFVNGNGKTLTLDQLKKRQPEAFKAAGI